MFLFVGEQARMYLGTSWCMCGNGDKRRPGTGTMEGQKSNTTLAFFSETLYRIAFVTHSRSLPALSTPSVFTTAPPSTASGTRAQEVYAGLDGSARDPRASQGGDVARAGGQVDDEVRREAAAGDGRRAVAVLLQKMLSAARSVAVVTLLVCREELWFSAKAGRIELAAWFWSGVLSQYCGWGV